MHLLIATVKDVKVWQSSAQSKWTAVIINFRKIQICFHSERDNFFHPSQQMFVDIQLLSDRDFRYLAALLRAFCYQVPSATLPCSILAFGEFKLYLNTSADSPRQKNAFSCSSTLHPFLVSAGIEVPSLLICFCIFLVLVSFGNWYMKCTTFSNTHTPEWWSLQANYLNTWTFQ